MGELRDPIRRQTRICELLGDRGSVSVTELSRELGVSQVTVRKDLAQLETRGLLKRLSGGAVPLWEGEESPFRYVPKSDNQELKHAVAREAAKYIQDGESVMVTSGATPHLSILYARQRKNLKLVTDSFYVAQDLCRRADYQTILLGGELHRGSNFIYGRDAVRQASRYMTDKAIVTMDGVDSAAGLTTFYTEGADTLKSILERSRFRIVVADITKIGKESFCHIGPVTIADVLITNETADPEKLRLLQKIEEAGVVVKFARM